MDNNVRFPGQPLAPAGRPQQPLKTPAAGSVPFSEVWQQALKKQEPVRISAHAMQRLQDRKISLDAQDLEKINGAVDAAGKKGARSSLLLYQDVAMVASIKNRTIITAMNGEELRDHIFTNIDSAVIIK